VGNRLDRRGNGKPQKFEGIEGVGGFVSCKHFGRLLVGNMSKIPPKRFPIIILIESRAQQIVLCGLHRKARLVNRTGKLEATINLG